jgi:hypothetical protein
MARVLEIFNYFTSENLPQVKTLIIGLVLLFGTFIGADGFLEKFVGLKIRAIIYLLFLSLWIGFWVFNKFCLPRNKKGKVGIVIAIYSENESERQ